MKTIVANLKMNLTKDEVILYLEKALELSNDKVNIIVAPSNLYLSLDEKYNKILCCQNAFHEEKGSYTGEISIPQLKSLGIKNILIHHSERVTNANETLKHANQKIKLALKYNMNPIICVGDTYEEKEAGLSCQSITKQLDTMLEDIKDIKNFIIAYEPVYAIGTGVLPSSLENSQILTHIENYISQKYNQTCPIIYGGSVDKNNIYDIINLFVAGCIVCGFVLNLDNLNELANMLNFI